MAKKAKVSTNLCSRVFCLGSVFILQHQAPYLAEMQRSAAFSDPRVTASYGFLQPQNSLLGNEGRGESRCDLETIVGKEGNLRSRHSADLKFP